MWFDEICEKEKPDIKGIQLIVNLFNSHMI